MLPRSGNHLRTLCVLAALLAAPLSRALATASWNGALTDAAGKPVGHAIVNLHPTSGGRDHTATTASDGKFVFAEIAAGAYQVSVAATDKIWNAATSMVVKEGDKLASALQLSPDGLELHVVIVPLAAAVAPAPAPSAAPLAPPASSGSVLLLNDPASSDHFHRSLLLACTAETRKFPTTHPKTSRSNDAIGP